MLTNEQLNSYHQDGYVLVENAVTDEQLAKLQQITLELIEESKTVSASNDVYDLEDGHSAENPKLTRIKLPHKQNSYFWDVLVDSRITEVLRQILGENVLLQTSKLNTKASSGGSAVEWHQDWAFYPHTNDGLLACGLFLDDVTDQNGPLQVIPGSHNGPVLSHHSNLGVFCGAIDPSDSDFEKDKAVTLKGRAGSMSVHHVRTIHGSAPNYSEKPRKILFFECSACDAWPLLGAGNYLQGLTQDEIWTELQERIIIGEPVLQPRIEIVPVRLPIPPAIDASSIFKVQKTGGANSAF